jgi:signal transduction histidine kinase
MNRYNSYLHDLNNKLTIIYGALRSCKNGEIPPEKKIDAVKARIQDIIHSLKSEFQFEEELEMEFMALSSEELRVTLLSMIEKLKLIYLGTSISFNDVNLNPKLNPFIKIEKNLLYQILENATENAVNASSSSIEITLTQNLKSTKIEIEDNGTGFKEDSLLEKADDVTSGTGIIKENMRLMDGEASYSTRNPQGVKLTLLFKST